MEAASSTSLTDFINHSVSQMDQQQESITNTGRAIQALMTQVSELTQQIQQLSIPAAPPTSPVPLAVPETSHRPEPRLPVPESYASEPNFCRAFLTRCSMHFSLQPRTFETEESKVAFVLTLLTGRAALWGTAVWENKDQCCASFHALAAEMRRVFDRAVAGKEAARRLADLKQGDCSVADYSIEFRTLAAEYNWKQEAQWDMFLHGLADRVQKEIYMLDLPSRLNGLIDLALRVDARPTRTPGGAGVRGSSEENTVGPVVDHEPMQSKPDSKVEATIGWDLHREVLTIHSASGKTEMGQLYTCQALLDSGTEGNFMDLHLAHELHLPITSLSHQISVCALNGQELPNISLTTGPITLVTSGNHTETIPFLLMDSPVASIVLGHPWLVKHNPRVDWGSHSISMWSESCHESCLVSACLSVSGSVFQEKAADLSNVPTEYLDLKEVFSKSCAASLPPHRPYDCAIDLLPGKKKAVQSQTYCQQLEAIDMPKVLGSCPGAHSSMSIAHGAPARGGGIC
ncbi:hypothetical protein PO909_033808 [Leuciscus waleckii]